MQSKLFSQTSNLLKNGSSLLQPINLLIYGLDNSYPTWQANNSNKFLYLLQWFFRIILLKYHNVKTKQAVPWLFPNFAPSLSRQCGGYHRIVHI